MNHQHHQHHPHHDTHAQSQKDAHAPPAVHTHHDAHTQHDKHEGHSVEMFRRKFWLTLALTIPTLVWGHMLQSALHYQAPHFQGAQWIPAIFGTAVFLYGGIVFLRGAVQELKAHLPGMMTLIALAITVAFVFSAAVTLGYTGMPLWEELATLVAIMVLGHWIEMRSVSQAQGALKELAKLMPTTATRIRSDGSQEEIAASDVANGDILLLRPGSGIPADGVVTEGSSAVNEAMITGESRPVEKQTGDKIIAGTINGNGSLRIKVTGTGEKTALAGIMRLVAQAQASRSRAQALADRAAFILTIAALAAAALTFIVWLSVGASMAFAVERVVTTLVISCPHALGLAVPLVIAISTTIGARNGLLIRDRRGLEEARKLDAVVFDKTGTLTFGEQRVVEIRTSGLAEDEALTLAASLEQDSEHPVAQALLATAKERKLSITSVRSFQALPGRGVRGELGGRQLHAGGPNLLVELKVRTDAAFQPFVENASSAGRAVVYLIENKSIIAAFAIADRIRPESAEAVKLLHEQGVQVVMLTGDALAVAEAVAHELGIDTVFAEVLPEQKSAKIEELKRQGKRVAMVGDGVNDAPALVSADVGIAIGAGTEVAVEAGDVVLVRSDPRDVARIIHLSRATYRKMIQNLWWAAGYNIVAIPLAAGVLANKGVLLSPAIGAVLMSLSTIIVAVNAQLLRRSGS